MSHEKKIQRAVSFILIVFVAFFFYFSGSSNFSAVGVNGIEAEAASSGKVKPKTIKSKKTKATSKRKLKFHQKPTKRKQFVKSVNNASQNLRRLASSKNKVNVETSKFSNADRIAKLLRNRSGITVLGHYNQGYGYTKVARELGANRFKIPTNVYKVLTKNNRAWPANRKFLDRVIKRADTVILSTNRSQVMKKSSLEQELKYLTKNGYTFNKLGTKMLPPK
ncbi:MAG: hypothetical protein V7727_04795 [Sneathiella sp.]